MFFNEMQNITVWLILPLICAVIVAILGMVVLLKDYKSIINKLFSLFCLAMFVWLFGTFMMFLNVAHPIDALWWDRFVYLGVILMPALMHHFSLVFTGNNGQRKLLFFTYMGSFLFLFISRTPLFVDSVYQYSWGVHSQARIFHDLFLVFFYYGVHIFLLNFWRKYKMVGDPNTKKQIIYIVVSFAVVMFVGGTAYLSAYGIDIRYPLSYLSGLAFPLLLFYAIFRHRLLDIKLVARKYSVYFASFSTVLLLGIILRYLLGLLLPNEGAISDVAILALVVIAAQPLQDYYYHFANRYLFSSLYDPQEVVSTLSEKLRSTLQIKKLYEYIAGTLDGAFHTEKIAILIYDEKKTSYTVRHNQLFGFYKETGAIDHGLHTFFIEHDEPIEINELQKLIRSDQKEVVGYLHALGVELINPLNIKDKPVGLILLGAKQSHDSYNEEDVKVLNVIGTQAAIALENALLYEDTKKFTIKLKKEIAQATEQLRDQNEKLQKLDQLKTEFVSVASHQLRTPLTATKWVLEYLNDALKNKATPEEKESLEELSVVNKKLIKLVNELLNISRIEDGRVRIDPKPMDFVKMVKTTMKEFMPLAKQQKLKVIEAYDELPLINLDEAVMSKAIANFLSNGIKYNKYGGALEITIKKTGKNAVLTIRDEGIGIPEAEKKNLFQKFYRASNAVSSHTEGTGLGLYIAKSAIELSGGSLSLNSTEGKGSTFTITIPLAGSKKIEGEKSLT